MAVCSCGLKATDTVRDSLRNVLVSELGEVVDSIYVSPEPCLGQFAHRYGLMRPGAGDSFPCTATCRMFWPKCIHQGKCELSLPATCLQGSPSLADGNPRSWQNRQSPAMQNKSVTLMEQQSHITRGTVTLASGRADFGRSSAWPTSGSRNAATLSANTMADTKIKQIAICLSDAHRQPRFSVMLLAEWNRKMTGASLVDCGLCSTHKSAESNLLTGFVRMVHVRSQIKSTPCLSSV